MRAWDFNDLTFVMLFIIILVAVLAVIVLIVTFIVSYRKSLKIRKNIRAQSNTVRIYILNTKKNMVSYFNRTDLKKRGVMDFNTFFNHFHENDSSRVKEWIRSICLHEDNTSSYIEADVMIPKYNQQYFSLLKLVHFDEEHGLINIESHILKYITPNNTLIKRKRGMIQGVVKRSVMSDLITENKTTDGYTFAIRFFHIHKAALVDETIERFMLMSLKNEIYPFLSNASYPRQIVEEENNELLLFDLKLSTKDNAVLLAESIARNIKKCISIQSFSDSVSFAIGISENRLYYQNFEAMVSQAKNACIIAEQKKIDYFFARPGNYAKGQSSEFNKEIHHLLQGEDIKYLYRPILDTKTSSVMGYISNVKVYDSPFTSVYEMSKYASMANKGKELFSLFAKNIIPKFASQTMEYSNVELFMNTSLYDLEYIHTVLPEINFVNDTKIVLVFREQEIKENSINVDKLISILESCKTDGYKIAMFLTDKNLLLDNNIYKEFDYFICGSSMIGEIKKNNQTRLSIHTLIEQLLRFDKPIIATDLEGWQAVELILKAGISVISSETISSSKEIILPLDKKKLDKIALMAEKYL